MLIVRSVNGVPIRFTGERWNHITRRYVEMEGLRDAVLQTMDRPDFVQRGDEGALLAVRRWSEDPIAGRFVVVVYREAGADDGFVVTAYLTHHPATWRETVWRP